MLLPQIIHTIQLRADPLTDELMAALGSGPREHYLKRLGEDEFRRRVHDLFANLGRWLEAGRAAEVERAYTPLGRHRAAQGVPASEVVGALIYAKNHLWSFIKRHEQPATMADLAQEDELLAMISRFFDHAVLHALRGYESAMDERVGGRIGEMQRG